MKFYRCQRCGNIVTHLEESGVNVVCCGDKMTQLIANSTDAAKEKHVPVVVREGNKVKVSVGEVTHPMSEEHYIQWIVLETKKSQQTVKLTPQDKPEAEFMILDNDEVVAAYEYCNLHGLWHN